MAFNDNAVFTASTGYVFTAPVGTAAPTPQEIANFHPEAFGAHTHKLTVEGKPTGGTFTLTVGDQTTDPLPHNASAGAVQAALEKLSTVGTGNVIVWGEDLTLGYRVAFIGDKFSQTVEITAEGSLTGGTSAKATIEESAKPIGWEPIGHTAQDDLPEFGYEGGDKETKGSWQKKNLKEVTTETPVDYVTVKLNQFDNSTFELYYGENASKIEGVFGVDGGDAPAVEKAVLIVLVDGNFKIGFAAAKASTRRDESISLATDDFSQLPVRATFVKHPGRHLFEWITPIAA